MGGVAAPKSAELSFVSWPFGSRAALVPGDAVVAGAAVGVPSTNAFVVEEPYPTESTSVPSAFRRPRPPPVAAMPVEYDWSGAGLSA